MPPHLAGREKEQSFFRNCLADLGNRIAPAREVVLYGPRGNGKTVLLAWLREECGAYPDVEVAALAPAEIPDGRRLSERLVPKHWWDRLTPEEMNVAGFSWRPGQADPPPLSDILSVRVRRRPLVLLCDEAHTLDIIVGRALLNASQEVGRRLPLLAVLAGTPNLEAHLNSMGASFWNRAAQLRLARLHAEGAAAALRRPFVTGGVQVVPEALDAMVEASQGYPYFVQVLGHAVWQEVAKLPGPRREVTLPLLAAAFPAFKRTCDEYYAQRAEELRKRRLLAAGRALAAEFETLRTVTAERLERVVEGVVGPDASGDAIETLQQLGFLWRVEGRLEWEPGIPSLMDFLREHAA